MDAYRPKWRCTGWAQWCPTRIAMPWASMNWPTSCGCTPGHVERHGADAVHVFARPEDANAIDVAELEQFGGDGLLMGFDVLEPDVHHPFGGDARGHHLGDRLGAGLEAGRRGHVLGLVVHVGELDHGAAEVGRRQGFEQVALTVQETDAGRTVHLVRAPGGEVHIKRVEIDLEVRYGLASVQDEESNLLHAHA